MSSLVESFIADSLTTHHESMGAIDIDTVRCQKLAEGTTSQAHLVTLISDQPAYRQVIVRTPLATASLSQAELYADYQHEFTIRKEVIPSSFTHQPRPYFLSDDPIPHIVEEYIEGWHPPADGNAWSPSQIAAFGATIASLHADTERPISRQEIQDPHTTLLGHHALITRRTLELCGGSQAASYLNTLNAIVHNELGTLAMRFEPSNAEVLDHCDLATGNIIFDKKDKPYFIDWSEATFMDPAQGLSFAYDTRSNTQGSDIRLSPDQQMILIRAYGNIKNVDEAFMQRLQIWRSVTALSLLVKNAGILLVPDAAHFWQPQYPEKAMDHLQASLISRDYPLP